MHVCACKEMDAQECVPFGHDRVRARGHSHGILNKTICHVERHRKGLHWLSGRDFSSNDQASYIAFDRVKSHIVHWEYSQE